MIESSAEAVIMLTAQRWVGDTLGDRRLGLPDLYRIVSGCANQGLRVLVQWSLPVYLSACLPGSLPLAEVWLR
jgi:hypothetical protein